MTNVIMISTDRKILEEGSAVRARMAEYGALFGELHIVVFAKKGAGTGSAQIARNVFAYPTESPSKFLYVKDARAAVRRVVSERGLAAGEAARVTVVTCQDPFETGLVGLGVSAEFGFPLHVQIHTDLMSPHFVRGNPLNRVRRWMAGRVLPRARAVRVVSERIRRSIEHVVPADRVSVLPIFADVGEAAGQVAADVRNRYPQFEKIVLMASRLTREKDIATAIDAFALARREGGAGGMAIKAGLVIVGEGPERAALEVRARAKGVADAVVFEPWADHSMVISYMKSCDVFLSTSLYEGYGLSMLEAQAAGAIVVATDAGIAPEVASAVCEPQDASCLAQSLKKGLEGTFQRRRVTYPYRDKAAYVEAFRADIERALRG